MVLRAKRVLLRLMICFAIFSWLMDWCSLACLSSVMSLIYII